MKCIERNIRMLFEQFVRETTDLAIPGTTAKSRYDVFQTGCRHSSKMRCPLCPTTKYQDHRRFTFTDPRVLFSGQELRPWPLNGELSAELLEGTIDEKDAGEMQKQEQQEAEKSRQPMRYEVKQATLEYLESIGLGPQFARPARRRDRDCLGNGNLFDSDSDAHLDQLFS
jgi:hypothetical protein